MTMTRVYLVCIESGHVAFTSEDAARRAGYTRTQPILLLDGPIMVERRRKGRYDGPAGRWQYTPLAGHAAPGVESAP